MTPAEAIEAVLNLAEAAIAEDPDGAYASTHEAIRIVRDIVLPHYKAQNDDQAQ